MNFLILLVHYGAEDEDEFIDPACEDTFQKMIDRAKSNTQLYREIFRCEPDNRQSDFGKLQQDRDYYNRLSPQQKQDLYEENKGRIEGHVVEYPIYYMADESLQLERTDFTNLVPKINFT